MSSSPHNSPPLHSMAKTVSYRVFYVGSIEVVVAMSSLEKEIRKDVTKECIYRVCCEANLVSRSPKHKCEAKVARALGDTPSLQLIGREVLLVISADKITVVDAETEDVDDTQVLHSHAMPNVSMASGGEGPTSDFVCFVARDGRGDRRCFVFECVTQSAAFVVQTLGTAFAERLQQQQQQQLAARKGPPPVVPPRSDLLSTTATHPPSSPQLISFDVPAEQTCATTTVTPVPSNATPSEPPVSPNASTPLQPSSSTSSAADTLVSSGGETTSSTGVASMTAPSARDLLVHKELWFHGPLERAVAESLVCNEGDFLVRQSTKNVRQYVLTGVQAQRPRHLLLVDENGKIRTKDSEFQSIPHLIQYHRDNNIPIASPDSALLLKNPILRRT